jgi:hypothetical protein
MSSRRTAERVAILLIGALAAGACSFDRGDRWVASADTGLTACVVGQSRCAVGLEQCRAGAGGPEWVTTDDCGSRGLICAPAIVRCAKCAPGATRCAGSAVEQCKGDGTAFAPDHPCDTSIGDACRDGACVNLCDRAGEQRSNVGCEYWGADLDNANIDDSKNAAAQQFAIVVSNPQPDLAATVTVEQDDTAPGALNAPVEIARTTVPPLSLRVLKLGPREIDGSPRGQYNTGTHTAVTRAAYRVGSSVPIIAYQFNPLDNVNVFSNDASLLKPVEALRTGGGALTPAYVVLGWPQTIAVTDDPNTNFSSSVALHLRAFLTIVGTRSGTHVRVHTKAAIVPGGPILATPAGGDVVVALEPFDVVNLETGSFQADFTGSVIDADQPVVVFSGSEASDAPAWNKLGDRQCCADHLEEQLDPIRTAGKRFIATVSPNRTDALIRAGARSLGHFDAPEFFRVAAATAAGATIRTTLPAPDDRVVLKGLGDFASITSKIDFLLESTEPISLSSVSPSQGASGVPFTLPGGDPSLVIIPPVEQFRPNYVVLTPDKYSFDFLRIVAPKDARVILDGDSLDTLPGCHPTDVPILGSSEVAFTVYRCQLGFPVVDTSATAQVPLSPGIQNDGVHRIEASTRVGVIVDGFDKNVSYAYAGGTELTEIVPE